MSAVERKLRERGFRCIAGTDEVGRGALAGPVVAAAVILEQDCSLFGVNDSKLLTLDARKLTCSLILRHARSVSIGVVEAHVIDEVNILQASKRAMRDAVESLPVRPDMLLLDAVYLERLEMPQIALIKGDRRSISIAAASIVAKVYRDMLMESYDALYPQYDFMHNRGYGTESHLKALDEKGMTPIHRRSFERSAAEVSLFD